MEMEELIENLNVLPLWESEPMTWEGEMCYALRHPEFGFWCGYVGVPENHPWFGKSYEELNDPYPEVHGGITYSADHRPQQEPDGLWWFGFDCGHINDFAPGVVAVLAELGMDTENHREDTYRSLEYVKAEIMNLMKQAVAATKK